MNIEEIKELIRLADETGVAELEVQRGEQRVRIRRAVAEQQYVLPAMSAPAAVMAAAAPAAAASASPAQVKADETEKLFIVKSPIVGTFYGSPSPEAPPFVKPGDIVSAKTPICIIESMKLMNEIEAETAGTVVACLVENGKPVEYGEALFSIRPA
jgi:acetyl-CoA carboxylase biotin carboxyl carrier protein